MFSMNSNSLRRLVEAFHLVLMFCFSLYLPYIFEAMPSVESAEMVAKEYQMQCGVKEDETAVEQEAETVKLPVVSEDLGATKLEKSQQVAGKQASTETDSSQNSDACEVDTGGRLTVMPFLVALIGGGVFSLEEFEAFPML